MPGYLQIYTGDGKGKTTAALGLALRATGAGLRVALIQFLKTGDYSEIKALRRLAPPVHIAQFGTGRFVRGRPGAEDRAMAAKGLAAAREALWGGENDVVILDEINVVGSLGLVDPEAVLAMLDKRAPHVEVVLTGRNAPPGWCAAADLVTVMQAQKHYFSKGVAARTGIEK
ncbi:MAG: cob(I)yrinic acid a,c-diamide adenosyltransferase [Desulfobacterales bacterium]|nr:cob(I)yrinic acid a,c-diamide adenosyltransferase [Desulfobacterales bacterium]